MTAPGSSPDLVRRRRSGNRPESGSAETQAEHQEHASSSKSALPFFATFGRELAGWCGLRPGQRVLDVAAGRGAITLPAARAVGPRGLVVAVDNAPNMRAALARDRGDLPRIKICGMDAPRPPSPMPPSTW